MFSTRAAAFFVDSVMFQTPLPKPVYLPEALDGTVPSRDAGREIPIRIYKPDNHHRGPLVEMFSTRAAAFFVDSVMFSGRNLEMSRLFI
jgi:hypothetical protein